MAWTFNPFTGKLDYYVSGVTSVTGTAPIVSSGGVTPAISITDFIASGASHARGAVPDPGAVAGTTKFLREDATWNVPAGGGAAGLLALDKHVIDSNFVITAGWATYIPRYLEIALGITLEIGLDSDLEIG